MPIWPTPVQNSIRQWDPVQTSHCGRPACDPQRPLPHCLHISNTGGAHELIDCVFPPQLTYQSYLQCKNVHKHNLSVFSLLPKHPHSDHWVKWNSTCETSLHSPTVSRGWHYVQWLKSGQQLFVGRYWEALILSTAFNSLIGQIFYKLLLHFWT